MVQHGDQGHAAKNVSKENRRHKPAQIGAPREFAASHEAKHILRARVEAMKRPVSGHQNDDYPRPVPAQDGSQTDRPMSHSANIALVTLGVCT